MAQQAVNDPQADTSPFNVQNTPAIVDMGGGRLVAAFYDNGATASRRVGFAFTSDNGSNWTDGGQLPDSPLGVGGDPILANRAGTGTVYLATLGQAEFDQVPVFKSIDFGHSWSAPVNGAPGYETSNSLVTKPFIAVDNFAGTGLGNVYLCASRYNGAFFETRLWRSTNGGGSFTPTLGTLIGPGGPGCEVVVSPNHQVNVFYIKGTGPNGFGGDNKIFMRRSTDRGATFVAGQVQVADLKTTTPNGSLELLGGIDTNTYPHVAVNPDAARPYLYGIFNDDLTPANKADDNGDIFMVRSINNGATWSAPVKVNTETGDQFHPDIAFISAGGRFGISYYTRSPSNDSYHRQFRGGYLLPQNGPWAFNIALPVSPATPPPVSRWPGEWDQLAGGANAVSIIWSDQRDLDPANLEHQPDIRFARVTLPPTTSNVGVNLFASPTSVPLGKNTVLTSTVTAAGGAATDVSLSFDRLLGINYQSAVADGGFCNIADQNVDCYLGTIAAGASKNVYTVVTGVNAAATRAVTAVVATSSADTTPANNTDTVNATVTQRPPVTQTFSTGNIAIAIPDGRRALVPLGIAVAGTSIEIIARVRLNHTSDSDLSLSLRQPGFSLSLPHAVQLSRRNGGSGDNYGNGPNNCGGGKTVFSDLGATWVGHASAPFVGTFRPQEWLATFAGFRFDGTWTLVVDDWELNLQSGVIGCFELTITYIP